MSENSESSQHESGALRGDANTLHRRLLVQAILPTIAVGVVLTVLCLTVARSPRPQGDSAGLAWLTLSVCVAVVAVGTTVAVRNARRHLRSFEEVGQAVQVAARKLGRELPAVRTAPEGIVGQVHRLVDGIDRILEERQQREREVMRADQLAMVGQIAAGVAHELRNPLTSVKMLVQTNLKEATRRGLPGEDLEIIEQEIRRMERCLQRFLDFARPPKPERRPVSLAALVDQTFALVEGRARRQAVTLSFDRPLLPVIAEADEDQIRQLLVNLVLNALDAMPDGGRIDVGLGKSDDDWVELRVFDTGPGIPQDLFPTLFDPFVSTKETGIGLGLAVSHRIAAGHGGDLTAVNRPEGGACFFLHLPVSQ